MTTITLIKTLPSSSYYSTGAGITPCTINLESAQEFHWNTKKVLIKVKRLKNKSRQTSSPSDQPDNLVIDLKKIDESMVIKAWVCDDANDTAWNKVWKLRGMCTRGGPLTSLTIGESGDSEPPKLVFDGSPLPEAFVEDFTFSVKSNDTGAITKYVYNNKSEIDANRNLEVGRIEVSISFYFGDER